jgi:hypothetical protein
MRYIFAVISFVCVLGASPAFAFKCAPDTDGTLAAKVLADPSISVMDVYVRGVSLANHQSMLDLKNRHSGSLMARNIRAKFGASDCAVVPRYKQTMTVLIKAEDDATYSIVGGCEHTAVINHLKKGQ